MDSMKNYRLAVDENGSPFVLNSKGSIDFGYHPVTLPPTVPVNFRLSIFTRTLATMYFDPPSDSSSELVVSHLH